MAYFTFTMAAIVVGALVHTLVDHSPQRRTRPRVIELWLLWFVVGGGVWSIFGGLSHLGPNSGEVAASVGYARSFFQWRVGWADIAVGVLGVGCVRKRDSWLTAAVVALTVVYWGDAVGHVMQLIAHDNTATANVGAIPVDVLQPLVAVVLLVEYRRHQPAAGRTTTGPKVAD